MSFLEADWGIPIVVNTAFDDCGGEAVRSIVDGCVIKSSDVGELKEHIGMLLKRFAA